MKATNYFSNVLKLLMERNEVSGADIFKRTAVSESKVSMWKNGRQLFIEPEDMAKLTKAVSTSKGERAQLISAWLQDFKERCGDGQELISITINDNQGTHIFESAPAFPSNLSGTDRVVLSRLATKMATHPEVSKALKGMADALGA